MSDGGRWGARCGASLLLLATITAAAAHPLPAQQAGSKAELLVSGDTASADQLAKTPLPRTTVAAARVRPVQLDRLPVATIADALQLVPGITLVDADGLGFDPRPIVRGLHGGGRAGDLLVMFDGVPINDPESGLVAWDLLPAIAVDAVEVVRGGASWLYGEPALAGAVDLVTVRDDDRRGRWELAVSEHRTLRGSFSDESTVAGRLVRLFAGGLRTDGFRDNAVRTGGTIGLSADLASSDRRRLRLSGLWMRRDAEFPGPVSVSALPAGRARIEPFFRFDGRKEWVARGTLDGGVAVGGNGSDAMLTGALSLDVRRSNDARTLLVAHDVADSKERLLGTRRFRAAVQLEMTDVALPWDDRLVVGIDGSTVALDSEFYHILDGNGERYATAIITLFGRGVRDSLDASGTGARHAAAAYAAYELTPKPWLRLSAGARFDWLRDTFEPDQAPGGATGGVRAGDAEHTAFSPRVGVNVRWLQSDEQSGHVLASLGRSFEPPTPDQLFSQRHVPRDEPPFDGHVSDPSLRPQHASTLDLGAYHRLRWGPDGRDVRLSLVAYGMDVEDEIRFDRSELRYVRVGESRHRGVEAGLEVGGLPADGALFATYALHDAQVREGPLEGNDRAGVPRHHITGGATGALMPYVDAGIFVSHASGAWLDDANTVGLPGYTRVDAQAGVVVNELRLTVTVRNVFDRLYSTTGFVSPHGPGTTYLFPAAGRTLEIGLRAGAR